MVTIYHHNDMDGRVSAGVIYNYEAFYLKKENVNCIEVDYTMAIDISNIKDCSVVYFVDYSFSKLNNVSALIKLVKEKECKVVWIDHHISSKELLCDSRLNDIIDRTNFIHYIDTEFCASFLCYRWTIYTYGKDITINKCPEIIKYVDSWDTWKHNMPNTIEFNNGFNIRNLTIKEIAYVIELSIDSINRGLEKEYSKCFVEECIDQGRVITKYNEIQNANLRKKCGFEFYIDDHTISDHCFIIHKCIAINAHGNSTVFGDLIDKYNIVCLFRYSNNQWVYSLYSNKPTINCKDLAEKLGSLDGLGGGGHKGAAGFQTRNCILKDEQVIEIYKRVFFKSKFGKYKIKVVDK